jgi:hypothetical protein
MRKSFRIVVGLCFIGLLFVTLLCWFFPLPLIFFIFFIALPALFVTCRCLFRLVLGNSRICIFDLDLIVIAVRRFLLTFRFQLVTSGLNGFRLPFIRNLIVENLSQARR